jgi:hypothetical protein
MSSNRRLWAGRIITGVPVLFLIFDATIHLLNLPVVAESSARLGYPVSIAPTLGVLELIGLALYLFRPTAVLGAILLTGYLGGAVATHVRVGSPLLSHILFPVYVGLLLWGGLYLRNDWMRSLIPLQSAG